MSASSSTERSASKADKVIIPLATDERCWFKCRQTNAGRVRRVDPRCSMFCYYSNKIPTLPIRHPAELSSNPSTAPQCSTGPDSQDRSIIQISTQPISEDSQDKRALLIERYTIPGLRGKFLYFAIGAPAVARHLSSMRRMHSVEHTWIYEKLKEEDEKQGGREKAPKRPAEQSSRGLMVLAYHRDYERTVNISYSIASVFASIHLHFDRLYGPTFNILAKLPDSFSALVSSEHTIRPTQFALLSHLFTKPILSHSMTLASRSAESMVEVLSRLAARFRPNVSDHKGKNNPPGGPASPPSAPPSAS